MECKEWKPFQGRRTVEFGVWLTNYLVEKPEYKKYLVYYDHGDSSEHNVAEIKGFYGESVTRVNRLTDVDLLIAKQNGEIVLLVEIEETPQSPQKYIGLIFTILMSNQFAVGSHGNQKYFTPSHDTKLILTGRLPSMSRLQKINLVLIPLLRQFVDLFGRIDPKNVSLLFETSMDKTIDRLKLETEKIFTGDKSSSCVNFEHEKGNLYFSENYMSKYQ